MLGKSIGLGQHLGLIREKDGVCVCVCVVVVVGGLGAIINIVAPHEKKIGDSGNTDSFPAFSLSLPLSLLTLKKLEPGALEQS